MEYRLMKMVRDFLKGKVKDPNSNDEFKVACKAAVDSLGAVLRFF